MTRRPERPDPLFIRAGHLQAARILARDLGLPPSPTSPFWRYLSEAHQLRGYRLVRIVNGYDWPLHRAAEAIGDVLWWMRKTRGPQSVVYVDTRAEVLALFPELDPAYRPQVDDGPAGMTER